MTVHKADAYMWNPRCTVCGQRVHRITGGQGRTWVHSDSGAVAAPNPLSPLLRFPEWQSWPVVGWGEVSLGDIVAVDFTSSNTPVFVLGQVLRPDGDYADTEEITLGRKGYDSAVTISRLGNEDDAIIRRKPRDEENNK